MSSRLDEVLSFLSFVAKQRPLTVMLDEAPRQIAACLGAEVVSIYLLEGEGRELVLRGNVGFPLSARGTVRMEVGDGITGRAVAERQPIVTRAGLEDSRSRVFDELDEGRYPHLVAMPILGSTGPLGAVVLQRAAPAFTDTEICLVAALTAPITSAIRLARLLDELRPRAEKRPQRGGRRVTLTGRPLRLGRTMGSVAAQGRVQPSDEITDDDRGRFEEAVAQARRTLRERVEACAMTDPARRWLEDHLLMLDERRLHDETTGALAEGASLATALARVVNTATRVAADGNEPFLIERARELEALCNALLAIAHPERLPPIPAKALVVAPRLSVFDILVTARAKPAGFVLTDRAEIGPSSRERMLAELLAVPAIADVVGVFRWSAPGDIAVLDADHGLLIVNPSRADIAAVRASRKRERASQAGLTPPLA